MTTNKPAQKDMLATASHIVSIGNDERIISYIGKKRLEDWGLTDPLDFRHGKGASESPVIQFYDLGHLKKLIQILEETTAGNDSSQKIVRLSFLTNPEDKCMALKLTLQVAAVGARLEVYAACRREEGMRAP